VGANGTSRSIQRLRTFRSVRSRKSERKTKTGIGGGEMFPAGRKPFRRGGGIPMSATKRGWGEKTYNGLGESPKGREGGLEGSSQGHHAENTEGECL